MTNEQAPTTEQTTTTALPTEVGHTVISVATTKEQRQMPLERAASVGELTSKCLVVSTGTAALLSLLALVAPAYVPLACGALAGTTAVGLGVRSAYKGKLHLTEAALAASLVVGITSVSLNLRPTPQGQAPAHEQNFRQAKEVQPRVQR